MGWTEILLCPQPGLGDSPRADAPTRSQAGAQGPEEGTGGEIKEEEEQGQPSPLSWED